MHIIRPIGAAATTSIILAVILTSCKGSTPPEQDPVIFPSKNISFANQVQPYFDDGCALSGCHDINARAGGLALDSWQDVLTSDPGVVISDDTTHSRLIWRIEGAKGLPRMPLGLPGATANQVHGLKQWILKGAQNN
jgi:hypothetical protein